MDVEAIKYIVAAVLSAGGALAIKSLADGIGLWRNGTARTEARGISNLERFRKVAEYALLVAVHRLEFYRDTLNPYLRLRIAILEGVIIRKLGESELPPPTGPEPLMPPIPEKDKELLELEAKASADDDDKP